MREEGKGKRQKEQKGQDRSSREVGTELMVCALLYTPVAQKTCLLILADSYPNARSFLSKKQFLSTNYDIKKSHKAAFLRLWRFFFRNYPALQWLILKSFFACNQVWMLCVHNRETEKYVII